MTFKRVANGIQDDMLSAGVNYGLESTITNGTHVASAINMPRALTVGLKERKLIRT